MTPIKLSKRRRPRGSTDTPTWEAYIPNGWLLLGVSVSAETRTEAKARVRAEALRQYGYKQLEFER